MAGNATSNTIGNRVIPLTCSGHTRPVVHLSFSPLLKEDEKYLLVSSCKDGSPMLRDWVGDWIGTFVGHKGAVWSTKLCKDASKAATASADFTSKIWDTFSGEVLQTFPHNHIVRTVSLSPSASHLLTGGNEKKIRMWDLVRPDAPPVILKHSKDSEVSHDGTIKSVIWDADRAVCVSAGEDKMIRWWDLRSQQLTHSVTMPDPIASMELSITAKQLVVSSGKKVDFVYLVPDKKPTHSVTLDHPVSSASLHPTHHDKFVAGCTNDPWVRVYDIDGGEAKEVYKGHHGPVHCVEYSPDGEMYASGSEDGTVRLWQTTPGKSYGLWDGVDDQ